MKLGSLFDGSGGFPLAGSLCGIEPVWASEIEPYPIAVTRTRFPKMKHLGDISKISGAEIEPVDIITFGSPCQDLSVAGKRAGLKHEANGDDETTRSGLFMEAVRIIKEMREATNGKYPTFALWENVPGAFSSNKGEDFRIVCEELIKIAEPNAVMPEVPAKGWPYADSYCGDGWSLSYRVFDAQYWGVPQRRRRIHLIVDFRGERAGKILFEREGLRGYFAEGRTPWQAAAADAERCLGADDREGTGIINLNQGDVQSKTVLDPQGIAPALYAGECRGGGGECYVLDKAAVPYTLKIRCGCEGGGKGALIQKDLSATLATNNDQYLFQPVVGVLLDDQGGQQINVRTDDVCPTLRAETHGNLPCVVGVDFYNQALTGNVAKTLNSAATDADHLPCVVYDARGNGDGKTASTITGDHERRITDYTSMVVSAVDQGGGSECLVCESEECQIYRQGGFAEYIEDEVGTLRAAGGDLGGGSENLVRVRYIVRRLTPTECARLQGFPDRWGDIEPKTDFTDEEWSFWAGVRNTHAAINGKAVKSYTKAQMLTWYSKLHTDSAEYKMWGNGIALPPALYCMQGIKEVQNES
jgi:DNA (cytosine-5)-methyltransferase 1